MVPAPAVEGGLDSGVAAEDRADLVARIHLPQDHNDLVGGKSALYYLSLTIAEREFAAEITD